ncbi:yippee-domain-containing protein [Microthyrium microscopicum]|uniref:Yippee-domain-containing protein n=1 Tax=Microthyrium microscopicum TaxID=703497 RepID=A0A6A6UGI9_9PEZI|nr:yippee-domain-containing protein [Microthyrium microscopicum]
MPILNSLTATFPNYLIPSNPFRRRSSSSSTASEEPYLSGSTSLLRCSRCLAHLCPTTAIISKGFTGRHGRAYLIAPTQSTPIAGASALPNTTTHKPQPRQLATGAHTVADLSCALCGSILGWKYVAAEEESQQYKVGKVILETKRTVRSVLWEDCQFDDMGATIAKPDMAVRRESDASSVTMVDESVEFDSQDEDECEDLFLGVWSEALARKRRREKAWRKQE